MFYLVCSILCSVIISCILKAVGKTIRNSAVMFGTNYIICVIFAICFMGGEGLSRIFTGSTYAESPMLLLILITGFISGILYPLGFIFSQISIQRNGVAMASTFSKLGVIVPTIMAIIVFGEKLNFIRGAGIALSLLAILVIGLAGRGAGQQGKSDFKWLLLNLAAGGLSTCGSKIFEELGNTSGKDHFLIIIFGVALVYCIIWELMSKGEIYWRDALVGVALGIPNYMSSRFQMMALEQVDAVVVFPVYSVGTILMLTLAGMLIFKEKLSAIQLIGMFLIMIAMLLLNL